MVLNNGFYGIKESSLLKKVRYSSLGLLTVCISERFSCTLSIIYNNSFDITKAIEGH